MVVVEIAVGNLRLCVALLIAEGELHVADGRLPLGNAVLADRPEFVLGRIPPFNERAEQVGERFAQRSRFVLIEESAPRDKGRDGVGVFVRDDVRRAPLTVERTARAAVAANNEEGGEG